MAPPFFMDDPVTYKTTEEKAAYDRKRRAKLGFPYEMWKAAKKRARRLDLPFNIVYQDIVIPELCPVFGTPLVHGKGKSSWASPTLDRFRPELGYVKGNIAVICNSANSMKRYYTTEQVGLLYNWMKSHD